jgi:hypothetical protein
LKIRLLFFFSLLIVTFQLLISFPISIWIQNQFNFSVELVYALDLLGAVFSAVSVILLILALAVPEKARNYLLPLFVLLSVLIYLQQNVLVWDYGFLDGHQIDFRKNNFPGLIDLFAWSLGLLIFVRFRKQVTNWAGSILLFSGLLTVLATAIALNSLEFEVDRTPGTISELDKFSYSDQQNILLFILDGFQSDLFWDLIDNEPGIKEAFPGFTFYPNTSSVYAKTFPTIPLLLTGKTYKKQQPFVDFLSRSYENSLLTSLVDEGWDVGLYPQFKSTIVIDDSIMSNYVELLGKDEKLKDYRVALDLSFFRAAPHLLKSLVYNDGDFIFQGNPAVNPDSSAALVGSADQTGLPIRHPHEGINFLGNMQTLGNTRPGRPTFRFYHLNMPHRPFLLDRDLNYGRLDDDFSAYREYAFASVKLMIAYLNEMERLGIYDNSSIIITADHGGGEITDKKYISADRQYVAISKDGGKKASGRPLLLIKRINGRSPFRLSPKPASLQDIAPTIASFAGISGQEFDGLAVDEIVDGEPRSRIYYFYSFTGFDSRYLGDFHIYQVDGDVYQESSWKEKGILTGPEVRNKQKDYVLNSDINYGSDAKNSADYMNAFLTSDNHVYEPSQLVSDSGSLDISLRLKESLESNAFYLLELELAALDGTSNVTIELNSVEVPSYPFSNDAGRRIAFFNPVGTGVKDKLDIHLETRTVSTGKSPLSISKLNLRPANLATIGKGSVIHFSDGLEGYYINGFWDAEPWGRWTSSTESALHFLAPSDFCLDSFIYLNVGKFYQGVDPGMFMVRLNGETLKLVSSDRHTNKSDYYFECPQGQLKDSGVNRLVLSTDKVESALSNIDSRMLGAAIGALEITDKHLEISKEPTK